MATLFYRLSDEGRRDVRDLDRRGDLEVGKRLLVTLERDKDEWGLKLT